MTVLIPPVDDDGHTVKCCPLNPMLDEGLIGLFKAEQNDSVMCMYNKTPAWNERKSGS
jgi:hypothetical protein